MTNPNFKYCARGIYYTAERDSKGNECCPLKEDLYSHKLIFNRKGEMIGFECCPSVLNKYGLSTYKPDHTYIMSNNHSMFVPESVKIVPMRPPTKITKENIRYLQYLDIVKNTRLGDISMPARLGYKNEDKLMNDLIERFRLDVVELARIGREVLKPKDVQRLDRYIAYQDDNRQAV